MLDWHAALNAGDIARLLSLCADDVEVGGPRGISRGRNILEDWVARANIRLRPGRIEQYGTSVIVEQRAAWSDGEPQPVGSVFEVRDGVVARVIRYPDFKSALEAVHA